MCSYRLARSNNQIVAMGGPQHEPEDTTMNVSAPIFALCLTFGTAQAQSMIDERCGQDHVNQITELGDVISNPDGYYVRSLQTQLSHGDPRIVRAVGTEYRLCTRPAVTPDMDANEALLLKNKRVVKFLFVPIKNCPKPNS